ncbi:MAG: FliA/WhiG family RNA polymerase sigma factor [Bacillota bacterium]|nr:FliA/WhiG family RNA polymerase sigma factor [Bacillota bacterium]
MNAVSIEELWKSYKLHGDQEAKDELIVHYVSLVKIIAGRLYVDYNHNVEYDDIVSYGILGLIDAIEKYDIDKANKFETYANFRIKGAVIDQLRALDWIPRSLRQKYREYEKAVQEMQSRSSGEFTDAELASLMGISEQDLSKLESSLSTFSVASLEEKFENRKEIDILDDPSIDSNPERALLDKDTKDQLAAGIDKLGERERTIISLYYYEELTYKEIAEIIGISESRISQIHTKAITKLRNYLS